MEYRTLDSLLIPCWPRSIVYQANPLGSDKISYFGVGQDFQLVLPRALQPRRRFPESLVRISRVAHQFSCALRQAAQQARYSLPGQLAGLRDPAKMVRGRHSARSTCLRASRASSFSPRACTPCLSTAPARSSPVERAARKLTPRARRESPLFRAAWPAAAQSQTVRAACARVCDHPSASARFPHRAPWRFARSTPFPLRVWRVACRDLEQQAVRTALELPGIVQQTRDGRARRDR